MIATIFRKKQIHDIAHIIHEYSELIRLSSPSDEQLNRIEEILNQAIYNHQLDENLNKVDEELAREINSLPSDNLLIEENQLNPESPITLISKDTGNQNVTALSQPSICLNQELTVQHSGRHRHRYIDMDDERNQKPDFLKTGDSNLIEFPNSKLLPLSENKSILRQHEWLQNNIKLISCLAGIFILLNSPFLYTVFHVKGVFGNVAHNYSVISSSPTSETDKKAKLSEIKTSICSIDLSTAPAEMKDYYNSYLQLDKKIKNQQLQNLEIKMEVKQLQREAERQQRKWEIEQRFAELEKFKAEQQNKFGIAQKWQNKASDSSANAKKWLCLSRQALALYR